MNMIQLEGELFEAVQFPGIFEDSKTFVDCIPKIQEEKILRRYHEKFRQKNFNLEAFLRKYFIFPHDTASPAVRVDRSSMENYIESLWYSLSREPGKGRENDTLIPLKYRYIIPGGRFREIYYWDTYFTSVGLVVIDRFDLIAGMVKNFIYLQDKLGLIPNGNRKYYVSRTQPPVLAYMVKLLYRRFGIKYIAPFLPALEKEHAFWMNGSQELTEKKVATQRVVRMPDGSLLNRYCDPLCIPRQESYKEDVGIVKNLPKEKRKELYQNIRSAAESGWDFSSRWLEDINNKQSMITTSIVPIDLNALLYGLEKLLDKYYRKLGFAKQANFYSEAAKKRKAAIDKYLWNAKEKFYFDYNWKTQKQTGVYALSSVVPMFVEMASEEQVDGIEKHLKKKFLKMGGLITTLIETGEQWDAPNGWAPLQWFAVKGLLNYGRHETAFEIIQRWVGSMRSDFAKCEMLMEKYNVCSKDRYASGGEYRVQGGFGWTNGTALKFLQLERKLAHKLGKDIQNADELTTI